MYDGDQPVLIRRHAKRTPNTMPFDHCSELSDLKTHASGDGLNPPSARTATRPFRIRLTMLAVTTFLEGPAPVIPPATNCYMASVPGRIAGSLNESPNPFPGTVVFAGTIAFTWGPGGAGCFAVLLDRQVG